MGARPRRPDGRTPSTGPSWQDARHLLAAFDGSATELWVLDLPMDRLPHVIACLTRLRDLRASTDANGEPLAEPVPFDAAWARRFAAPALTRRTRAMVSARHTDGHLQVDVFAGPAESPLDVEFVFWNDVTFAPGLAEGERIRRLDALVALARDLRRGATGAFCLLTGECAGDPRDRLGDPGVLTW